MLRLLTLRIGQKVVQRCSPDSDASEEGCRAVLDTGSGYMMGPQHTVDALQALAQLENVERCRALASLPDITLELQGSAGPFELHLAAEEYSSSHKAGASEPSCELLFSPVGLASEAVDIWVLGLPLLRRSPTAYDVAGLREAFAVPTADTKVAQHVPPAVAARAGAGLAVAAEHRIRLGRLRRHHAPASPLAAEKDGRGFFDGVLR